MHIAIFPRGQTRCTRCADDSEQACNFWRPGQMGGGEW